MVQGIIFDLDGTLVDSKLDFVAIRRDLGLREREPILEAIERRPDPAERRRLHDILDRHELAGAESATLMPGVAELLLDLEAKRVRTAVFTRNSRLATGHTLRRLKLNVPIVVAREDAPPKPDPAGLKLICAQWNAKPARVVFIGDYIYDLEAGEKAGVQTVLYAPSEPDFPHDAKWVLPHFAGLWPLCHEIFRTP